MDKLKKNYKDLFVIQNYINFNSEALKNIIKMWINEIKKYEFIVDETYSIWETLWSHFTFLLWSFG